MSGVKTAVPGIKGPSTLVRATFAAGMLLQHEDMERLQAYPGELSRLLFRRLFGCGVVCGLVVSVKVECGKVYVKVGAGLGLDCAGDPVYVPTDQSFPLDEECNAVLPNELWVVLCGAVKQCAPRPSMCGDDDEPPMVRTRDRDWFAISVTEAPPPCACGCGGLKLEDYEGPKENSECWCVDPCHPCYEAHYAGECGCQCDDCGDCNGKCIVLARLKKDTTEKSNGLDYTWKPDHSVRRFIRPVLMRDPRVAIEQKRPRCREPKTADGKPTEPTAPGQAEKESMEALEGSAFDPSQGEKSAGKAKKGGKGSNPD